MRPLPPRAAGSGGRRLIGVAVTFFLLLAMALQTSASHAADTPVNLARNPGARAVASYQDGSYLAANAIDGNTATRWSSDHSNDNNAWIYVDLGGEYAVSSTSLTWEAAYAGAYKIQVSDDSTHWTDAYSTTTGHGGTETATVNKNAHYVRMQGVTPATQYGYSLWEFAVYGTSTGGGSSTGPVGTWGTAMQSAGSTFAQQTLRQVVHSTIGGTGTRIHLSNAFGNAPVTLSDVHLAMPVANGGIDPATDRALTFGGASSVTIPAGGSAVSDAAAFTVPADADLAVSLYVPQSALSTWHQTANVTNYVAPGDQSGATALSGAQTNTSTHFLAGLDVQNAASPGAVVAFGASITDAISSTFGAYHRWPDLLSDRLLDSGRAVGVINEGISGNGLVFDGGGQKATTRFQRDVLDQPGVKWVIFGDDVVNDLLNPNPPSLAQIQSALGQLVGAAHAQGLTFICSTLTPFKGTNGWTQSREDERAAYNAYLRTPASGCDAVNDVDAATHDPANPQAYLPAYDAGDHLHPNDAGMQAIANAVQLSLFGAPTTAPRVNLALGRPTQASSVEAGSTLVAANATDGNRTTRWASAAADPQSLTVDLGQTRTLTQVELDWEAAYAAAYQIQVSPDGVSQWQTIASSTTGHGGDVWVPVSGTGRWVRLLGTTRGTPYGYSLWEFGVYGQ
jgi:lysophospholipase L1-like esterase